MKRLTKDLFAVGLHGKTGQATEEGTLAAGSLIKQIKAGGGDGTLRRWMFLASTDGGKTWYKQVSYEAPQLDDRTVERLDAGQRKEPHYRWYIAEKHPGGTWLDPAICRQFPTKTEALGALQHG